MVTTITVIVAGAVLIAACIVLSAFVLSSRISREEEEIPRRKQ